MRKYFCEMLLDGSRQNYGIDGFGSHADHGEEGSSGFQAAFGAGQVAGYPDDKNVSFVLIEHQCVLTVGGDGYKGWAATSFDEADYFSGIYIEDAEVGARAGGDK